jgi:hypothetical protein
VNYFLNCSVMIKMNSKKILKTRNHKNFLHINVQNQSCPLNLPKICYIFQFDPKNVNISRLGSGALVWHIWDATVRTKSLRANSKKVALLDPNSFNDC